jgi:hypothetical protein
MNVERVRRDLRILTDLVRQGEIRGVDWSPDPRDPWIIVLGAFRLPAGRFNLPDCNLKLPLPANLYDRLPGPRERYAFYSPIFIDERLRRRGPGGGWEPIPRQYRPEGAEAGKGWAFLCVQPGAVGQETDIRAVFPIVQRFLFNPR